MLDRMTSVFTTERMGKRESLLSSLVVQPQPDVVPNRYIGSRTTGGKENPVFETEDLKVQLRVDLSHLKHRKEDEEEAESGLNGRDSSSTMTSSTEELPEKKPKNETTTTTTANRPDDIDICFPNRNKPNFPRVEIVISDVLDEGASPIERHMEIADSVFYQSPALSAEGNLCSGADAIYDRNSGRRLHAPVQWCGCNKHHRNHQHRNKKHYSPVLARMEMPRDAYNKLITWSALNYLVRPTNEDSKEECFPNEAYGGNRLLLPSIADAVRFCMYGRAFEELGQCLWYWGSCSVDTAVKMLQDKKVGSFLVRNSRQASCPITMTTRTEKGINSLRIEFDQKVVITSLSDDPCCLHHAAEEARVFSLVRTALSYSDLLASADPLRTQEEPPHHLATPQQSYLKMQSRILYPIKIYHRASIQHLSRLALNQVHGTWKEPDVRARLLRHMAPKQADYLLKYPYPV